ISISTNTSTFTVILVILFCCSAPHRKLHSFPTRRSSDLFLGSAHNPLIIGADPSAADFKIEDVTIPEAIGVDRTARRRRMLDKRSEEHTSELQSQSNLVCRLLLEKKKKT